MLPNCFLVFRHSKFKTVFGEMNWKANTLVRGQRPRLKLPCGKRALLSVHRHQSSPGTAKGQLNPESRCQKQVDFPGLNLLEVACSDLRPFGQFFLRQPLANALTPHICAEDFNSLPLFSGNRHDILHRFPSQKVNDTYIVKMVLLFLKENPNSSVLILEGTT